MPISSCKIGIQSLFSAAPYRRNNWLLVVIANAQELLHQISQLCG